MKRLLDRDIERAVREGLAQGLAAGGDLSGAVRAALPAAFSGVYVARDSRSGKAVLREMNPRRTPGDRLRLDPEIRRTVERLVEAKRGTRAPRHVPGGPLRIGGSARAERGAGVARVDEGRLQRDPYYRLAVAKAGARLRHDGRRWVVV